MLYHFLFEIVIFGDDCFELEKVFDENKTRHSENLISGIIMSCNLYSFLMELKTMGTFSIIPFLRCRLEFDKKSFLL